MRLNLLMGVDRGLVEPESHKCLNPDVRPRSGAKHPGDPRAKLSATRAIAGEYVHSYLVNDAPSEYVMKTPFETANPDVSGFTSRACRSAPRNTRAGDESLSGAMTELRSSEGRRK